MLGSLKQFFEQFNAAADEQDQQHSIELACAVLLMEISKADANISNEEVKNIRHLLENSMKVNPEELDELLTLAQQQSEQATSLYPFTQMINEQFEYQDKIELMRSMWNVAYTDGRLDKYEEYQIRKLSDLLYIAHGDFIRTKLDVLTLREEGS